MNRVYFHTFGCKVNQYETESLREKLEIRGYSPTHDFKDCQIAVINSCSVTAEADRKCRQFVRKILRSNSEARVIVTGCYATRDPQRLKEVSPRIEIFSNQEKEMIPESVSGCSLLSGESSILTLFSGHTRAFVKVQDGCDAPCTYCIIPKVRPGMVSRKIEEILREVKSLLKIGTKEIVLTGIRLGSYGLSSSGGRVGKNHGELVSLLKEMVQLPGDFRIRLSSLEITEVTVELLDLAKSSNKICPHFHLPLQSGEDSVLKRMGRWYDSTYYSEKVKEIRGILPEVGITADLIVGFPGETEENFTHTLQFIENHLDGLHVFPFSKRPGTPAYKLPRQNEESIISDRVNRAIQLDTQLRSRFLKRFTGTKRLVLAEANGAFTDNGIRIPPPLPIPKGTLSWMVI